MWSFAYHGTDPAPFVNVEQPWDEPASAGDASEIDVPSHWVLRGEGAWGHPAYTNVDFPFPVDRRSRPTTTPSATTAAPSNSPPTGREATFACVLTALKVRPACG